MVACGCLQLQPIGTIHSLYYAIKFLATSIFCAGKKYIYTFFYYKFLHVIIAYCCIRDTYTFRTTKSSVRKCLLFKCLFIILICTYNLIMLLR